MKEKVRTRLESPEYERVEQLTEEWDSTRSGTLRRLIELGIDYHDNYSGEGGPGRLAPKRVCVDGGNEEYPVEAVLIEESALPIAKLRVEEDINE